METILEIAKQSPTAIYLGGVIFLFLRLEKANKRFEELVDRYHNTLLEGIRYMKTED